MKKTLWVLLLFTSILVKANDTTKITPNDPVKPTLVYVTEPSILLENYIRINIPEGFSLLDRTSSIYVSENEIGNIPDPNLLGLLIKSNEEGELVYIVYLMENKDGYIKDEDAKDIDKDQILKDIQEGEKQYYKENPYAKKMFTQSWAIDPKYDQTNHVLHFAKLFQEMGEQSLTLNYQLYKMNKHGYVNITVACDSSLLEEVIQDLPQLYNVISYENQSSYSDFDPSTGNYAQWTVGGLVAGKILAKSGILALILKNLKLVIIGIGAAFYGLIKFFKKRKEDSIDVVAEQESEVEPESNKQ